MDRRRVFATFASLAFVVGGCGGSAAPGGGGDPSGSWTLEAGTLDGSPVPLLDDRPISLHLDAYAAGMTPCNSYGGAVERGLDGGLSIVDISQTLIGCDGPRADAESGYLAALSKVDSFEQSGAGLLLTGPEVALSFIAATGIPGEFAPGVDVDADLPPTTAAPPMPEEEDCLFTAPQRITTEPTSETMAEAVTTTTVVGQC